jgi:hypothetical protein
VRRLGGVIIAAAALWLVLRWLSPGGVTWLIYDDAYYYFGIARNVAAGLGSTFDGLHPTNGYHPLWLGLCTLPFLLGLDDELAVRAILSLAIVGLALATHLLLRIVARRAASERQGTVVGLWVVALMFSPVGILWFASGLETTLTVVFVAALAERLDAYGPELFEPSAGDGLSARRRLTIAALLAGAFLSRTDAVFLIGWLGAWAAFRGGRGRPLVELLALPVVVVAAYLVANQLVFGAATQVSGDAKRVQPSLAALALAAVIVVLPLRFATGRAEGWFVRTPELVTRCFPILGFGFTLIAYYFAFQRQQQPWYFVVPVLFVTLMSAMILLDAAASERRWLWATGLVLGALVLGASVVDLVIGGRDSMARANQQAGRWMREHLPADAVIAGWDCGALGFYARRPVVNLDGMVGSVDYVRALRSGRVVPWTRGLAVRYVANHHDREAGMRRLAASYLGAERLEGAEVVRSWPFRYRGATNRHAAGTHDMAVWLLELRPH